MSELTGTSMRNANVSALCLRLCHVGTVILMTQELRRGHHCLVIKTKITDPWLLLFTSKDYHIVKY